MKKLLFSQLIWLFLIFPLCIKAQQPYSKILAPPYSESIEAYSLNPTSDNGYLVSGGSNQKGIVIRMDTAGNVLWNRTFGNNLLINQAKIWNDSSIIAVGYIYNTITSHSYAMCIKLKLNGDTIWTKAFLPTGATNANPLTVQPTNDSGFIITGEVDYAATPYYRSFVAKFDGTGILQWTKQFSGSTNLIAYSIKQTPDSGYVITGHYDPYGSFAIKLLPNGNIAWAKEYGGNSYYSYDVIIVNNGMIFSADNTLFKTDFSGNVLWGKTYNPGFGYMFLNPMRVHQTQDGGFIFINSSSCAYGLGCKIVKTDSLGNLIWSDNLDLIAMDIVETFDKGYLIIGNGPMCLEKELGNPIGLIKTDSLGSGSGLQCFQHNTDTSADIDVGGSNITFTTTSGAIFSSIKPIIDSIQIETYPGCVPATGAVHEIKSENYKLSLSPNPTTGLINIQLPQSFGLAKTLAIYNIMGQLQSVQSEGTNIDISELGAGLYFVVATNARGEKLNAKVIKE